MKYLNNTLKNNNNKQAKPKIEFQCTSGNSKITRYGLNPY